MDEKLTSFVELLNRQRTSPPAPEETSDLPAWARFALAKLPPSRTPHPVLPTAPAEAEAKIEIAAPATPAPPAMPAAPEPKLEPPPVEAPIIAAVAAVVPPPPPLIVVPPPPLIVVPRVAEPAEAVVTVAPLPRAPPELIEPPKLPAVITSSFVEVFAPLAEIPQGPEWKGASDLGPAEMAAFFAPEVMALSAETVMPSLPAVAASRRRRGPSGRAIAMAIPLVVVAIGMAAFWYVRPQVQGPSAPPMPARQVQASPSAPPMPARQVQASPSVASMPERAVATDTRALPEPEATVLPPQIAAAVDDKPAPAQPLATLADVPAQSMAEVTPQPAPEKIAEAAPPIRTNAARPAARVASNAPDGNPAWLRNALPAPPVTGEPRIAVVIDDLGLDKKRTERAIALKGPLTLSFLAYASDLPQQTDAARRAGHELIVHVPMEPVGRLKDSGAAVAANIGQDELLRRLRWDLGRFEGYVGINDHVGSRVGDDPIAMAVVIGELKSRGLMFLDGEDNSGAGETIADRLGVPMAKRDVFIDDDINSAAISARLGELEKVARRRGTAIAIAHPHDQTLDALAAWVARLPARGIQLVPLTAIVEERYREHLAGAN
jgi:uncharacterized protein